MIVYEVWVREQWTICNRIRLALGIVRKSVHEDSPLGKVSFSVHVHRYYVSRTCQCHLEQGARAIKLVDYRIRVLKPTMLVTYLTCMHSQVAFSLIHTALPIKLKACPLVSWHQVNKDPLTDGLCLAGTLRPLQSMLCSLCQERSKSAGPLNTT